MVCGVITLTVSKGKTMWKVPMWSSKQQARCWWRCQLCRQVNFFYATVIVCTCFASLSHACYKLFIFHFCWKTRDHLAGLESHQSQRQSSHTCLYIRQKCFCKGSYKHIKSLSGSSTSITMFMGHTIKVLWPSLHTPLLIYTHMW